jgi:2'-5' RNA ligase
MPRYNLAYCPTDDSFAETCISFAYSELRDLADGFILNAQNSLPHVTLMQFQAEEEQIDLLWRQATALCKTQYNVNLESMGLRNSFRTGHVWVELNIIHEPVLLEMQNNVAIALKASGAELLTPFGQGYHPHLSLARLKQAPSPMPIWPDKMNLTQPQRFGLTLGLSDETGSYVEKLKVG